MLIIDKENNSAVAIGQLCGVKSRQTQSGKPLTIFSVIVGTHLDEFDNRVNDYQSCISFASIAEYVDAVTQEQNRTKYIVAGILRDNEYQGKTEKQIIVEYIAPQPQAEITVQKKKWDDYDDEINF